QYILAVLRSLLVVLPSSFLLIKTSSKSPLFYLILIFAISLTIFMFLRTLKIFRLYSDSLAIERPLLRSEVFPINLIKKIIFYESGSYKTKSYIMKIISTNSENEFSLIYFGKDLE